MPTCIRSVLRTSSGSFRRSLHWPLRKPRRPHLPRRFAPRRFLALSRSRRNPPPKRKPPARSRPLKSNCERSGDFAEGEVVAIGAGEGVAAWLEGQDAVEAHAGGASPNDDVAVLEEDAAGGA